jgi:hypothetical protein
MGQFYRGTPAEFLDNKMFQAPYELMASIIDKKDKAVDDNISTLTAYSDKLKADVLEEDSPGTRAKIQEYQQRIDQTISGIQNDPMNYQKYAPEITKISRDITQDWSSTGEIGTREANKKLFLTEKERIADLVKAGKLDPAIATIEEAKIREKYKAEGGLKWNKESKKPENTLDIQDQYYKVDFDEKFLTHMKPEEWSKEWDTPSGMYIYTDKQSGKRLTQEDIIKTYIDQVGADTPTLYAANRYAQLGTEGEDLAGYEGINKPGEAYGYVGVKGKDGKTYKTLQTNPSNYWGRKAQAAAEVFEQKSSSTSQSMKNDSYKQEIAKEERAKVEEVIIQTESAIGLKNHSSTSAGVTWKVNNTKLETLKTELGSLAINNGLKPDSAEYKAVISGNRKALEAMFTDPKTVDKYMNQYNSINMELNLQKASVEAFNKTHKTKLSPDANTWSAAEKTMYDKEMSKKNAIVSGKGNATFNGLNLNNETQKEVRNTVASYITGGTGNFTTLQGIPSIKYKGAKVRYLDSQNGMYQAALDPEKAVTITVGNKTHYAKKLGGLSAEGKYLFTIGGKTVAVDPKNVLMTFGTPGGEVNLNHYANQGHIQSAEVLSPETGGTVMAFQTMEGGKLVKIEVDKENTAPSRTLNNKKQNYIQSSFKIGNQGIDVQISGEEVYTPSLKSAWDRTYEQRDIETTKLKYGGDYKAEVKGPKGTTYRVEDGKYYIDTPTKKGNPVTDPAVILQIDKAILYKNN